MAVIIRASLLSFQFSENFADLSPEPSKFQNKYYFFLDSKATKGWWCIFWNLTDYELRLAIVFLNDVCLVKLFCISGFGVAVKSSFWNKRNWSLFSENWITLFHCTKCLFTHSSMVSVCNAIYLYEWQTLFLKDEWVRKTRTETNRQWNWR